jgi:hypothetical protein
MGATNYITSELDKLTVCEKYGGADQVHIASGSGMPISHVGQSTIHTHDRDLILKDISYMFLSINSLMIIIPSLNFTHGIFFLRIGTRRTFFFIEDVGTGFIPFLWQLGHLNTLTIRMLSPPLSQIWLDGIIGWCMPLFLLSNVWLAGINCPASRRPPVSQCVMHVKGLKATNCCFQFHLVCPKLL